MKERLDRFVANVYSQFGEDGCIAHILDRIGPGDRVAVEFGAGDGLSCSNTAALWRDKEWRGFLVESDAVRYEQLEGNARLFNTICRRAFVQPEGAFSISSLLAEHGITDVDVMSIDIDGDDYFILDKLAVRPRLVVVEFNPTVPPHVELRQDEPGGTFGASMLALIRLGEARGFRFVGATYCNVFLVRADYAKPFNGYERNPEVLFPASRYTYAVTDFAGRVVLAGEPLPWAAREPYVRPLAASVSLTPATDSAQQMRRGFEALWGPALWTLLTAFVAPTIEESIDKLAAYLSGRPHLVCIDLTNDQPDAESWLVEAAETFGYKSVLAGRVLGLIRQ